MGAIVDQILPCLSYSLAWFVQGGRTAACPTLHHRCLEREDDELGRAVGASATYHRWYRRILHADGLPCLEVAAGDHLGRRHLLCLEHEHQPPAHLVAAASFLHSPHHGGLRPLHHGLLHPLHPPLFPLLVVAH